MSVVSIVTGKKTYLKHYTGQGVFHPGIRRSRGSRWLVVSGALDGGGDDILAGQSDANSGAGPRTVAATEAPIAKASSLRMKDYRVVEAVYSPDRRKVAAEGVRGEYQKPGYDAGISVCNPGSSTRVRGTQSTFRAGARRYDYRNEAADRELRWLPNGKGIAFRRASHEDEGI